MAHEELIRRLGYLCPLCNRPWIEHCHGGLHNGFVSYAIDPIQLPPCGVEVYYTLDGKYVTWITNHPCPRCGVKTSYRANNRLLLTTPWEIVNQCCNVEIIVERMRPRLKHEEPPHAA